MSRPSQTFITANCPSPVMFWAKQCKTFTASARLEIGLWVEGRWAAEYLVEEVATLRKGIEKAEAPPRKKGAAQQPPPPKVRASAYSHSVHDICAHPDQQ